MRVGSGGYRLRVCDLCYPVVAEQYASRLARAEIFKRGGYGRRWDPPSLDDFTVREVRYLKLAVTAIAEALIVEGVT